MQKKSGWGLLLWIICGSAIAQTCTTVGDVKLADARWQHALASQNPENVAALYASNAVLLATFENTPLNTPQSRFQYFDRLFDHMKSLHVVFNKQIPQVFQGGAVSSGLYTFKGIKNGESTEVAARYTFVYEATPNGCQLIEHHSSVLPKTPVSDKNQA